MSNLSADLLENTYCSKKLKKLAETYTDDSEKLFKTAWNECKSERQYLLSFAKTEAFCDHVLSSTCVLNLKKQLIRNQALQVLSLLVKNKESALANLDLIKNTVFVGSISIENQKKLGIANLFKFGLLRFIPLKLSYEEIVDICRFYKPVYTRVNYLDLSGYLEDFKIFSYLYEFAAEKIPDLFLRTISMKLTEQFNYLISKGYCIEDYQEDIVLIAAAKNYKKLLLSIIDTISQERKDIALILALYAKKYKAAQILIENGASCYAMCKEALNIMKTEKLTDLIKVAEKNSFSIKEGIDYNTI